MVIDRIEEGVYLWRLHAVMFCHCFFFCSKLYREDSSNHLLTLSLRAYKILELVLSTSN